MLSELTARYKDAKNIWEAQYDQDCRKAADSLEWETYMDLSSQIIELQCSTIREIREKAQFILGDNNLVDLLANGDTDATVISFLKSIGGSPVDNGGN